MRLNYILIPAAVLGVAILGSVFTGVGISSGWYSGLLKPDWTPPGNVIGAFWTVIFVLTTVSILIVWNRCAHDSRFRHVMWAFVLNGILNAGWSYIFFVRNWMGWGVLVAVMMWLSVIELMVSLWPLKKTSSLLLLPYACWLIVASVLNFLVWRMN
jgi:tryptophan-rich sensory protein